MQALRRREAIKAGVGGDGVGSNILGVEEVAYLELRQLLSYRDSVEGVAGRAEYGRYLQVPLFKRLQRLLAVAEDDAGECVVDDVIQIVARLSVADGLADYLGDERSGCCDHESS